RFNDLVSGFNGASARMQALSKNLRQMSDESGKLMTDLNSDQGPSQRLARIGDRFDELGERFRTMSDRIGEGRGSLGQFIVDPAFSDALSDAQTQFQTLIRDLQANPKKFLRLRLTLF